MGNQVFAKEQKSKKVNITTTTIFSTNECQLVENWYLNITLRENVAE